MKCLREFTVCSLSQNLPGPLAMQDLCKMGARIIKIEPPQGDPLKKICPQWYKELHKNIEIHKIDLKENLEPIYTILKKSNLFFLLFKHQV